MKRTNNLISTFASIFFSSNINKENHYKKALFYYLKDKGGVYNKFLQVLCITKKFMEGWSTTQEYKVFNQALFEYIDISQYIDVSYFESYEENPIGIGSFAQVYKGVLKSGETVAIKILKPSISNNLSKDLKSLKRLVSFVSLFMKNFIIDIKDAYQEFSEICLREPNYASEIANMDYFYELYENHPYIKIPRVYHELSKDLVIVQEFIEGVSLADLMANYSKEESLWDACMRLTGSNIWTQLTVIGGELLRTAMTKDFIYGDPHPGNIILLKDNKVSFVDFGIVANKPISHRAFFDWTQSYYNILTSNKES
ncbi:MAG: AarF/ABC1/UbiB kinase family protein, partial [Bacilli bacterium]|nr:AarF/ABC1/UbiB kinase family protein [Bacilli bacterium]